MARWLDVVVGLIHTCITVVYTLAVSHADKYPCANIEHKRAHSTHKSNHNLMIIKPQQQQINSSNSPKFYMHAHSWIKCYAWNYHDRRTRQKRNQTLPDSISLLHWFSHFTIKEKVYEKNCAPPVCGILIWWMRFGLPCLAIFCLLALLFILPFSPHKASVFNS